MSLHLHIDHLVVGGLPLEARQRSHFLEAFEQELGYLVLQNLQAAAPRSAVLPSLKIPALPLSPASTPVQMGHQVARTLAGGLSLHTPSSHE